MNRRAKLLLVWAVAGAVLLVAVGVVAAQMILPHYADRAQVVGANDLRVGEIGLYECFRATGQCTPTQGTGSHYVEFANTVKNGAVGEYAVIWVSHPSPGEWRAFSAVSTHHECFVQWKAERERFEDPCGGARWQESGAYQEGPAPRALDTFPVRVENGAVWIELRLVRGEKHD